MSTRKTSKATKKTTPKKDRAATSAKPTSIVEVEPHQTFTENDIAIIGMSCRFPGANNPQEFWENLIAGKDSIREIPEDRWDWREYWGDPETEDNKTNSKWGGFVDDVDKFDADFFGISPKEAEMMDPQQRILLELSWSCIEDAGYSSGKLSGRAVGVFIGLFNFDYKELIERHPHSIPAHHGTGSAATIKANRISYFFNWSGPSLAIDTACSGSLYAIHQGVQSIRNGECEQALVGGMSLLLTPTRYISFAKTGMLSPTGQCHSFSENADGYVRGEGGGLILLKPLAKAIADNDRIYGLVKGSALNHGGKAYTLTYPRSESQSDVIYKAWSNAGLSAQDMNYIEAHGTGTPKGDPIEWRGLEMAFERLSEDSEKVAKGCCGIGSVKTNIGHLESAAGIAGVIKVLMALKHSKLPGLQGFTSLNPRIDLTESPFYPLAETEDWKRPEKGKSSTAVPLRAGVSSFGFGGTNAHVVLEEYVDELKIKNEELKIPGPYLVVLSAKNEDRLQAQVENLREFLEDAEELPHLSEVAYTLQVGREAMEERVGWIVETKEDLQSKLKAYLNDNKDGAVYRGQVKREKNTLAVFSSDEDTLDLIDKWLSKGKYDKLLDLWVRGLVFDWNKLYGAQKPRRVSLPTYPFARERYWIKKVGSWKLEVEKNQSALPHSLLKEAAKDLPNRSTGEYSASEAGTDEALVVIGGAGLFGLCMGVFLQRANIPFVIVEQYPDVGGVWYRNRWPGCGCDIPMLAYAYSFEHFKGKMWAKQPDILAYLQGVADNYQLRKNTRFGTRILHARYDENEGLWQLKLSNDTILSCKYFINATNEGLGHSKKMPDIPGMDLFSGSMQHVLDCDCPTEDFRGKTVAVIGNGTTQIQLVESLQPIVRKLFVYARSPKYIYPRARYAEKTQQRLSEDYSFWLAQREEYLKGTDQFYHALNGPIKLNPFHPDNELKSYFNRTINDEWHEFYRWLEEKGLVPDYFPGCSRPCMSHSYHMQIRAPNVHLETQAIERITENGLVVAGREEKVDRIICATGYDLNGFRPTFPIVGKNGVHITECFSDFPRMYAGTALTGFPNLFFGAGTNSSTNATSITAMYEYKCAQLLKLIQHCENEGIKSLEIKATEVDRFVDFVRHTNRTVSFGSGCSSWYQTAQGENAAIFPGTLEDFKVWQQFDSRLFDLEYYTGQNLPEDELRLVNKLQIKDTVLDLFSTITGISKDKLDIEEPIAGYGIDSIILAQLVQNVNKHFRLSLKVIEFLAMENLGAVVRKVVTALAEQAPEAPSVKSASESCATPAQPVLFSPKENPTVDGAPRFTQKPLERSYSGDIAIIGMSGIFPEAPTLDQFWQNLEAGKDCIREIPESRWDWKAIYGDPLKGDYCNVKWGAFIEDVDCFDPRFFHISPLEAELMDPQHRLYLQCVYQAIESAGYNPKRLQGKRIGVYYSSNTVDYRQLIRKSASHVTGIGMQGQEHIFAPSRVSFMLGLTGPCELIDTACSSSAVALLHAVRAIQHDGCEAAIVGASNLMLLDEHHRMYNRAGMLSTSDGRCKTFAATADGYARGEGVAAILLKPLAQAELDNDPILAVIRGIAENHGGQSSSITAPNVNAQSALIKQVLEESKADPRQIGLIECHGTGTQLGDPIEVSALKTAYRSVYGQQDMAQEFTEKRTGLGSVKSNIGHTEPLAGLAGLIKLVLALKNKVLPQTLHVDEVNPLLKLEESPFYILQNKKEWAAPLIDGQALPRMAAMSSFGVGNTNVHLLIEEYVQAQAPSTVSEESSSSAPQMIVLSARTKEQLERIVKNLLVYVSENRHSLNLPDIAYTLQVGREAMKVRLAFIADSMDNLQRTLRQICEGNAGSNDGSYCYRGEVQRDSGWEEFGGEDSATLLRIWLQNRAWEKLLQFWVKGLPVDWEGIDRKTLYHQMHRPGRIYLPPYPFARERYWIEEGRSLKSEVRNGERAVLHPLLHENTSTLAEQRFSSVFTGKEFFLNDHRVQGQKVLPEVAYLEMAREAVEQAMPDRSASTMIELNNIVWSQPFVVEKNKSVNITLFTEDHGKIDYEIYSEEEGQAVIHCQGQAVLVSESVPDKLDVREMGEQLQVLSLSVAVANSPGDYVLHPYLLDHVWQAALGSSGENILFPIALESLRIFAPCVKDMLIWVRSSAGSSASDEVRKLDIDLCDENGTVCVRMTGLVIDELRLSESESSQTKFHTNEISLPVKEETAEVLLFEEVWQPLERELKSRDASIHTLVCFLSDGDTRQSLTDLFTVLNPEIRLIFVTPGSDYQRHSAFEYQIIAEEAESYAKALQQIKEDHGSVDALLYLWPLEEVRFVRSCQPIVAILQSLHQSNLVIPKILLVGEYRNELERCYLESWIGFERSLGLVLPNVELAVLFRAASGLGDLSEWMFQWWHHLMTKEAPSMHCEGEIYETLTVRPLKLTPGAALLNGDATVLITGGCGGLGLLFARHLAKNRQVNFILTGRSALTKGKRASIEELEALGSAVYYLQADVSDSGSMRKGLAKAKEYFGTIDAVIHAAGISSMESVTTKSLSDFESVLSPKIKGTLALDEVLKDEPLQWICYFSSSSATLGDFGSCDYAIGNRFELAYARYRNHLNEQGQSKCRALVIQWPLWQDGGIRTGDSEQTRLYLQSSGQGLLESEEGLELFDQLLSSQESSCLLIKGQRSRVERFLGLGEPMTEEPAVLQKRSLRGGRRPEMRGLSVDQCVLLDLKAQVNELLKVPLNQLDETSNLVDYGFDSILLAGFARALSTVYEIGLSPSLFFSHPTLEQLAAYLLREYPEKLKAFYETEAVAVKPSALQSVPKLAIRSRGNRFTRTTRLSTWDEPIAIIGMSGRFPEARSVKEMWEILVNGRDVVTEIPLERFDWRSYYGDSSKDFEKTNCKWTGCIPGIQEFDPLFFEISPREAELMDPQQRHLLQESWKALEDAGYGQDHLDSHRIGMFVGVEEGTYGRGNKDAGITSNHNGILASRLAYFLNLKGPAMAINTACSSGLVAAHQACQSLRSGECDTAIAAGVNLLYGPELYIAMSRAGMLSGEGKCKAFARDADGMVPGEAVVALVLKPLSKAEAEGDPIYALIRGSGINYDGKTNGITAPSGAAQRDLLERVYQQYQIDPADIDYVVTHGTGTRLGDPVEINALYDVFKQQTQKQSYCALTSSKTNFGHTFAASGLVSVVNLVQALRHEAIPASLHCEEENDYIHWESSPFYINKSKRNWQVKDSKSRLGAVSAFGMSGTNAHMVIEDHVPSRTPSFSNSYPCYLLALSAKTAEALEEQMRNIIDAFESKEASFLALNSVSYTLLTGRHHFRYRCAVVIEDIADAIYVLKEALSSGKNPKLFQGEQTKDFKAQSVITENGNELLLRSQSQQAVPSDYRETLCALASLYCQGYTLNWSKLYGEAKPHRVNLPTYPFARDQYWIEEERRVKSEVKNVERALLHPLIHENTSTF